MNRAEFIRQLTILLNDVSPAEREEAIQYYNDYFDDAGAENEGSVIASLGTPEELARTIKAGLNDGGSVGEFTEAGFKGYGETKKNEVMKNGQSPYSQNAQGNNGSRTQKKPMSGGMIALIVIAVILSSPLWVGLAGGLFGVVVGLLATLLSLFAVFLVVGVALAAAGIALFVAGIATLFAAPLAGICLIGSGMVLFAVGLVLIWLMVIVIVTAIPGLVRGIVSLFNRLFHRGGAQA